MTPDAALAVAAEWARRGVGAFPVGIRWNDAKQATDKRPLTYANGNGGGGHLKATTDLDRLGRMFPTCAGRLGDGEELGVGIYPGPAELVVFDFDTKQGKAGGQTLTHLLQDFPDLASCRYRSASGALNVIVRKPPGLGAVSNAVPVDWHGTDIRGDGGWAVAPGTVTTWGTWAWDEGTVTVDEAYVLPSELARLLREAKPGQRPATSPELASFIASRTTYTDATRVLVDKHIATLAAAKDRHPTLVSVVGSIVGLDLVDLADAMTRVQETWDVLTVDEGREREPQDVLAWVVGQEQTKDGADAGASSDQRGLPDDFWLARSGLTHVRQAAWSRNRSAEAVLGTVLARIAADAPHTVELPATVGAPVGLSLLIALAGPPGTGKSSTKAIAQELVPARLIDQAADDVPPGSGEGLAELLFDIVQEDDPQSGKRVSVKRQVRHNAFVYADEGEALTRMASRNGGGSTFWPTLRSVFTSGTLGQFNASQEKRRVVPKRSYVFGIVVAFQPELAKALLDDAASGTPQRLLWMPTTTALPDTVPTWPGRLDYPRLAPPLLARHEVVDGTVGHRLTLPAAVATEVWASDRQRQLEGCAPLDEHLDLIRLKVAGILAVWDGRLDISDEDWSLAGRVVNCSVRTRQRVLEVIASVGTREREARLDYHADREVRADVAIERRRVADTARWIARKVQDEPDRWTRRELRSARQSDRRNYFDVGLDDAKAEGWVVEVSESSHTNDGQRHLRPGPKKVPT